MTYSMALQFSETCPALVYSPVSEFSLVEYTLRHTVQLYNLTIIRKLCRYLDLGLPVASGPTEMIDALLSSCSIDEETACTIRSLFLAAAQKRSRSKAADAADGSDAEEEVLVAAEPLPRVPAVLAAIAEAEVAFMRGEEVVVNIEAYLLLRHRK